MGDLTFAAKEKVIPDHDVIDEAIGEEAEVRINHPSILVSAPLNPRRDIPSSQYQSASSTDPIVLRSRTSKQRITLERLD